MLLNEMTFEEYMAGTPKQLENQELVSRLRDLLNEIKTYPSFVEGSLKFNELSKSDPDIIQLSTNVYYAAGITIRFGYDSEVVQKLYSTMVCKRLEVMLAHKYVDYEQFGEDKDHLSAYLVTFIPGVEHSKFEDFGSVYEVSVAARQQFERDILKLKKKRCTVYCENGNPGYLCTHPLTGHILVTLMEAVVFPAAEDFKRIYSLTEDLMNKITVRL